MKAFKQHRGVISPDDPLMLIASVVVTENILAYECVNSDGSKTDSAVVGKRSKLAGLALQNINNGFSGDIITEGIVTNVAWLFLKGDVIFLNGTFLSTTAPATGFIQRIGTMLTPITLELQFGESILL